MLTFDAASHVYRWNGTPVPSVTQILAPLSDFSAIAPEVLEAARDRGTAVHQMLELDAANDLEETGLDPVLAKYLEQFRRFVRQTGFRLLRCELQLYSPRYGYAGTLDLFGQFPHDKPCGDYSLLDTKAGAVPKSARPQTAAYAHLVAENGIVPAGVRIHRYALDLKPDNWHLTPEYRDPNDLRVFLAALTLHRFKEAA